MFVVYENQILVGEGERRRIKAALVSYLKTHELPETVRRQFLVMVKAFLDAEERWDTI